MLDAPLFRTLRLVVTGMVCALALQFALAAAPSESRICVGAMQTTACVPPA